MSLLRRHLLTRSFILFTCPNLHNSPPFASRILLPSSSLAGEPHTSRSGSMFSASKSMALLHFCITSDAHLLARSWRHGGLVFIPNRKREWKGLARHCITDILFSQPFCLFFVVLLEIGVFRAPSSALTCRRAKMGGLVWTETHHVISTRGGFVK
jgi:hypothetical protein